MSAGPIVPNTAIAAAFLRALVRLAYGKRRDRRMALPSGVADESELARVIVALVCARKGAFP